MGLLILWFARLHALAATVLKGPEGKNFGVDIVESCKLRSVGD